MSATNRGIARLSQDRYYTPPWAYEALFSHIRWKAVESFCEPCAGDGRILKAAKEQTSLHTHYWELDEDRNYLEEVELPLVDLIITNPPYNQARIFIARSLSHAHCICYLLRLNYLGSQARRQFWRHYPPSHLYVLSKRPSFDGSGRTDATEYAWFVWDKRGFFCDQRGVYVL